jgi:hypothetical protein
VYVRGNSAFWYVHTEILKKMGHAAAAVGVASLRGVYGGGGGGMLFPSPAVTDI